MVSLNSSAGVALGIDFGHRHLRVAVSDLSHTVLAETWREIDVDHSAEHGLDAAAEFVDQVLREADVDRARVIGVGMGLPAPIDRATGSVQSSSILPGWVGVDAAAEASPPRVSRSRSRTTPTSARSPSWSGAPARASPTSPTSRSHSGIGAGLISGGRLHHGVGGTGGRSATPWSPRPDRSAGAATAAAWRRSPRRGRSPGLLSASRGEEISTRRLLELCAAGDAAAQRLIGDAGRAIGVAVANLCNLLNPECVIVGGDLSAAAATSLLEPLRDAVRRNAIPSAVEDLEIVPGVLGERAELLGALALVMHESDRFAEAELLNEAA